MIESIVHLAAPGKIRRVKLGLTLGCVFIPPEPLDFIEVLKGFIRQTGEVAIVKIGFDGAVGGYVILSCGGSPARIALRERHSASDF